MAGRVLEAVENKKKGLFGIPEVGLQWKQQEECFHPGGLFASVGQMGMGFGMSSNPPTSKEKGLKIPYTDLYVKYVSPEFGYRSVGTLVEAGELGEDGHQSQTKPQRKGGLKFKVRVANASLRRLISGAIAGAVSRTTVAPLETIRTHLMVGSGGDSMAEVFHNIMTHEGWTGLFRGNLVNVIRVAPSRAIEVKNNNRAIISIYCFSGLLHFDFLHFNRCCFGRHRLLRREITQLSSYGHVFFFIGGLFFSESVL